MWLHRALIWVFKSASGRVKIASKVEGKISVRHCLLLHVQQCNVISYFMLHLNASHYLTFSSYQNKSCYFSFLCHTSCPGGRPTQRLKFARWNKILWCCKLTSALVMWLDWQILSVIAPYQNRLVASADQPKYHFALADVLIRLTRTHVVFSMERML